MFIFSYFPLLLPLCITNVISKCKQQVRRWCRQGSGATLPASITPFPFRPPFAKFALPPLPPSPLRRDQCYQCHRLFRPPVPPQHPRPARIRLISPISKPGVRAMNHRRRGGRLRRGGRCDLWPPARPRDGSHMRAHVPLTHTRTHAHKHTKSHVVSVIITITLIASITIIAAIIAGITISPIFIISMISPNYEVMKSETKDRRVRPS